MIHTCINDNAMIYLKFMEQSPSQEQTKQEQLFI